MAQNQNTDRGNQGGNQGGRGQGDTSNRGFASMDDDKQRAIAAEGGRAAHAQGTAHEFSSEEAREAGRKGGEARAQSSDSDRDEQSASSGGDNRGQQASGQERDEEGRFVSEDEDAGDASRGNEGGGREGGKSNN